MFVKIQGQTINLTKVKKFWSTYRGDVEAMSKGILVFEFYVWDRETFVFDNLKQAQEMEHNVIGFLDRKFVDFNL